MNIEVFYSKNTDDWRTPSTLYNKMMSLNYFDPCPYQSTFDGLTIEWKNKNYVNPPYSQLKVWIIKAIEEAKKRKRDNSLNTCSNRYTSVQTII